MSNFVGIILAHDFRDSCDFVSTNCIFLAITDSWKTDDRQPKAKSFSDSSSMRKLHSRLEGFKYSAIHH